MFYNTLSTVINVPYSAMSTEISIDYDEKTKVNTIRLIFSMVSSAISALVPTMITEKLQRGEITMIQFSIIISLVFGIFYCIPLVLAGLKSRERTEIPFEKSKFEVKTFIKPLKLKAFVYLLMSYLCAYSCMDLITTNVIFFADYGLKFSQSASLLLIVIMLSYAVMVPLISVLLSKGWAKPKIFRMGIPLYIIGIVLLCTYPSGAPEWPIYLYCVIIGIGTSGCQMIPWILFPDVVDVGELKFGYRPTGSFSGLMTFIKKSTSAIAIGITSLILGLSIVGFKAPITDYTTGIVTKFDQPDSAVWGLRL
jgi:Na+/melibiose symporter-like transporter